MTQESKHNIKTLAVTGAICAMGGYIGGDKIDEIDKLKQTERPYEMVQEMYRQAESKQAKWLKIQEQLYTTISSYKITIDSLKRITNQFYSCQGTINDKNNQINECEEAKSLLTQSNEQYRANLENEAQEVRIRDNQLDSLEQIAKQYQTAYSKVLEEYKDRASIESEFQAIHNCINAHGENMYSYQYQNQVKCCIKTVKKFQKQYPNNDLKNITLNCND